MDRLDDLAWIDPLQVGAGGPEVGMLELALDDVDGHPFAGELDSTPVSELVGSEAAPHAGLGGEFPEFCADGGRRPCPAAGRAVNDAEQRPDRKLHPVCEPAVDVLKSQVIHPDLPAAITLPWRINTDPRAGSTSVSASANASEILKPPRHSTAITARIRRPWRSSPAWRMTAMISSTRGGSAG